MIRSFILWSSIQNLPRIVENFSNLISQNTFSHMIRPPYCTLIDLINQPLHESSKTLPKFLCNGNQNFLSHCLSMQCHLLTKYILSAKGEGAIQQQDYQENVFTKDEFFY